jgi:hypothetical protein
MKPEYEISYERLYADYLYDERRIFRRRLPFFDDSEYEIVKSIRREIDASDKNESLRSDAKYFLLVNFHQMVLLPILEAGYDTTSIPKPVTDIPNLASSIESDIRKIVNSAFGSRLDQGQKVSGHEIMRTIDELWRTLECTKFDVWG